MRRKLQLQHTWISVKLWHMPHGITPPQSAPRSSNCYSLLWDSSTSLPVSTATHPRDNISTLSYKLSSPFEGAPFSCDWLPPILALLLTSDGSTSGITSKLSTMFSSTKSSKTSSCLPDCPATLMQDFYCRNELSARNSTDKTQCTFRSRSPAHKSASQCLRQLSSWLPPLLVHLLPMEVHTTIPSPLSPIFSSRRLLTFFPAYKTALRLWCICYQASTEQPIYLINQTVSFTSYQE